jgi:hypothetical protein
MVPAILLLIISFLSYRYFWKERLQYFKTPESKQSWVSGLIAGLSLATFGACVISISLELIKLL